MDILIKQLQEIKDAYQAEGIKIYFRDQNDYCIKIIKNGDNYKTFRKRDRFKPTFDLKLNTEKK